MNTIIILALTANFGVVLLEELRRSRKYHAALTAAFEREQQAGAEGSQLRKNVFKGTVKYEQ